MPHTEPVIAESTALALRAPLIDRHLDQPVPGVLSGDLILSGWVLADTGPVDWVIAVADQRRLAKVRADGLRRDIGERFPDRDHARQCGFRIRLPPTLIGKGREVVVAAAPREQDPIPIWSVYIGDPPPAGESAAAWRPELGQLETPFRVTALMSTFNEADIIEPVLKHLWANGIETYLIDNHSTDRTIDRARRWLGRALIGIETFPVEPPDGGRISWRAILERKVELARELGADWYIHHDADEIREVPWPNTSLREAIRWVDRVGFNAIDFRLLNFPPVDDAFRLGDDPRQHFRLWEEPREYDRVQRKCWKAGFPDLALEDGGHDVRFEGRRLFPIRFLLRHYPIRGQTHGSRKVLVERADRFIDEEVSLGWHRQYGHVTGSDHLFLSNPARLRPFDLDRMRLEAMLEGGEEPVGPSPPDEGHPDDGGYKGHLERVDATRIAGWAANRDGEVGPPGVEIWDGGKRIASVRADQHRPDIEQIGIGDGRSGFALGTPRELLDGRPHWIWATIEGAGWALGGSPCLLAAAEPAASPAD
jgi:hypothetical protein